MGLLTLGRPLSWEESKKYVDKVRHDGVAQFIAAYKRLKDRKKDELKFGDEIEYHLVSLDHTVQTAKVSLTGPQILDELQRPEVEHPDDHESKWRPEYASYMIEGTPGAQPFGFCTAYFNTVEANMTLRRQQLRDMLKDSSIVPVSCTAFPRLGCHGFTSPAYEPTPDSGASHSLFFPDEAIWQGHPRYRTLTQNIRERRGSKVAINIPIMVLPLMIIALALTAQIFKDEETPSPFVEKFPNDKDGQVSVAALPDHIYEDCMGFGMGCCCLQVTFQACDIDEARFLYDQLAVIGPVVMALSAATPVFRGYLADWDCRWLALEGSVDDRTEEERELKPLKESKFAIPKSRYSPISFYLTTDTYNDIKYPIDMDLYKKMRDEGLDHLLAQHMAHLFIRDPVSLFEEKVEQDLEKEMDHFENIQSTNWNSMRFKPPPPDSPIGWRVEFRPMEVQLTDFENAAFTVFIVLLTRTILSFGLNFLIPISKFAENMVTAQKRDAAHQGQFYFRKNVTPPESDTEEEDGEEKECAQCCPNEYTLMSADAIINGKDGFPGLIPLIRMYLNSINIDVDTRCTIRQYLSLISQRASGDLMTTATWMRKFITEHPDYKSDSVVNEKITYDLFCRMDRMASGEEQAPELTGKLQSRAQRVLVQDPTKSMQLGAEPQDTPTSAD